MSGLHPRDRLREIAGRLHRVLLTAGGAETVGAVREWDACSVQDASWLMKREAGLRAQLQRALRRVAELEDEGQKKGLRAAVVPRAKSVAEDMRVLSREVELQDVIDDAFSDHEAEWFETVIVGES